MEPSEFVARREAEKQSRIDAHKAATSRMPVGTRDSVVIPSLDLHQRRQQENAAREEAVRRNRVRDFYIRRQQPIPDEYLTEAERTAREGGAA